MLLFFPEITWDAGVKWRWWDLKPLHSNWSFNPVRPLYHTTSMDCCGHISFKYFIKGGKKTHEIKALFKKYKWRRRTGGILKGGSLQRKAGGAKLFASACGVHFNTKERRHLTLYSCGKGCLLMKKFNMSIDDKIESVWIGWIYLHLAEDSFDVPTSGLWVRHASAVPLCFQILTVVYILLYIPLWVLSWRRPLVGWNIAR